MLHGFLLPTPLTHCLHHLSPVDRLEESVSLFPQRCTALCSYFLYVKRLNSFNWWQKYERWNLSNLWHLWSSLFAPCDFHTVSTWTMPSCPRFLFSDFITTTNLVLAMSHIPVFKALSHLAVGLLNCTCRLHPASLPVCTCKCKYGKGVAPRAGFGLPHLQFIACRSFRKSHLASCFYLQKDTMSIHLFISVPFYTLNIRVEYLFTNSKKQ